MQLDTESIEYVDVAHNVIDAAAKQNHAIFARRGCGKTLLLHSSRKETAEGVAVVYLNCEVFKQHSFPNVLIEILRSLFSEIRSHATGWFGRSKKIRDSVDDILSKLDAIQAEQDQVEEDIRQLESTSATDGVNLNAAIGGDQVKISAGAQSSQVRRDEIEKTYKLYRDKLQKLELWLPKLKRDIAEFLSSSSRAKIIFIQVDDLYHLRRTDQAFVVDYLHRLCKDSPIYFKIATLRHASVLFVDRQGQPIGAQERHDYQAINIDYTFSDFDRTENQNWKILKNFGQRADLSEDQLWSLFKGEGFSRLVMAGGGVPRDVLSLFLEILSETDIEAGSQIGKDEVRALSKKNWERRIEELKHDAQDDEQGALLRAIYLIRTFCLSKKVNVFLVSEKEMQENDVWRAVIHRLLDYRIIHNCATALTHKSGNPGSYSAYSIDIGSYAFMRKLQDKFTEIDFKASNAKDRMRSAPILSPGDIDTMARDLPKNPEAALFDEPRE
ncbi:hypothetical protein [Sphingomonas suaedae]|uniref:hypothetical protein n=1 Tax=Sphingomonas suaedae TaxID=2599297 RepID=UPI001C94BE15|nr:hypothetical protein [Sphingomonas suaedae]